MIIVLLTSFYFSLSSYIFAVLYTLYVIDLICFRVVNVNFTINELIYPDIRNNKGENQFFFFFPKWSMLNLSVEPPAQTIQQNANEKTKTPKKTC